MSSALEYYAKQLKFLPAKACSWVSRDQRLWENSDKHISPPLLFRGEGMICLTTGLKNSWVFPDGLFHPLNKSTHLVISSHLRYCSPEQYQLLMQLRGPIISLFILKIFLKKISCYFDAASFKSNSFYIPPYTFIDGQSFWGWKVPRSLQPYSTWHLETKRTFFLPRSPAFAFVT